MRLKSSLTIPLNVSKTHLVRRHTSWWTEISLHIDAHALDTDIVSILAATIFICIQVHHLRIDRLVAENASTIALMRRFSSVRFEIVQPESRPAYVAPRIGLLPPASSIWKWSAITLARLLETCPFGETCTSSIYASRQRSAIQTRTLHAHNLARVVDVEFTKEKSSRPRRILDMYDTQCCTMDAVLVNVESMQSLQALELLCSDSNVTFSSAR